MMDQGKKTYSCILADDNELDRLTLYSQLRKAPFLEIVGQFSSAEEVLAYIAGNKLPDVIFVDIDMPGMNGLELRKKLPEVPACVFVTSHPEFAVDGFEAAALDFIVKPLRSPRFAETLSRLEWFLTLHYKAALLNYTLGADTIFIKDGVNYVKLNLHDVIYLEALKDYTGIVTAQRKFSVLSPLGTLLTEHSFRNFVRIHRSYAIQKHYIKKVSAKDIIVNNVSLPIGRSYKENIEKIIGH
jgi:two-component system, LytTR family, response regulator